MLPDVQNTNGDYRFDVEAGVANLMMPVMVKTREGNLQQTVALVDMKVLLDKSLKGINMSRLPIILNEMDRNKWVVDNLEGTLLKMMERLESKGAWMSLTFPYFYDKESPVTKHVGRSHVNVQFIAQATRSPYTYDFTLSVAVPVMTLCPCSKEISKVSAHNQRALVIMTVRYKEFVWIEELVEIAEKCSSSPLYPILKREDEKFVTESSYNKPKFVEDLARDVGTMLKEDGRIVQFKVEVESQESIHQHNAIATVRG